MTKPGCPVCGPRGDAYNQGTPPAPLHCALHLCRPLPLRLSPCVLDMSHLQRAVSQGLCSSPTSNAECHCKAGHVDKSKLSSKRHKDMDSAPDSPNSGSEASWAMEPKENKHKSRFAKLFHRKPKNHAAGSNATSVASSQASESSRYQVRNQSWPFCSLGLQLAEVGIVSILKLLPDPAVAPTTTLSTGKASLLLPQRPPRPMPRSVLTTRVPTCAHSALPCNDRIWMGCQSTSVG